PPRPPRVALFPYPTLFRSMQAGAGGPVTASTLKRTLLRKDPTFSEADYGFRAFGELLRHLAERNVVELSPGPAAGDPEVSLPERSEEHTSELQSRENIVCR